AIPPTWRWTSAAAPRRTGSRSRKPLPGRQVRAARPRTRAPRRRPDRAHDPGRMTRARPAHAGASRRQPLLTRRCQPGGDLGPRAEAELVQDAADVAVGGALGYEQAHADLLVGQAVGDQPRDV